MSKKVRVLYGVQSDGMGHALRSKPIIDYLIANGYAITILTSAKAFDFFTDYKPVWIPNISWTYVGDKVSYVQTAYHFLTTIFAKKKEAFKTIKQLNDKQKFDLIISDFEPFSAQFGATNNIPVVTIDNICFAMLADMPVVDQMVTKAVIKWWYPKVAHQIITTCFVPTREVPTNTTLFGPIIRAEIIKAKPTNKGHLLMYQTSNKNDSQILSELQKYPGQQFVYYGAANVGTFDNVVCKPFSNKEFLADLIGAKGVICSGFTLLSEAVYLHKPVWVVPVRGQSEQELNAKIVEREGLGIGGAITAENITRFVKGKFSVKVMCKYNDFDKIKRILENVKK